MLLLTDKINPPSKEQAAKILKDINNAIETLKNQVIITKAELSQLETRIEEYESIAIDLENIIRLPNSEPQKF